MKLLTKIKKSLEKIMSSHHKCNVITVIFLFNSICVFFVCFCFHHRQRRAETVQTTWILKHCQYANKIKIEFIMSTYVFLIHKTLHSICYTVCNFTVRRWRRSVVFYFAMEFRLWISINNLALALMESAAVCVCWVYELNVCTFRNHSGIDWLGEPVFMGESKWNEQFGV